MQNKVLTIRTQPGEKRAQFSTSLARGLAVLAAFSPDRPLLGITTLAALLEMDKSTTHRYVATLEELGYLEQDSESQKYRLGIKVVDLGLAALNAMEMRHIARPHMERLARESGHTINIGILDGADVFYVERVTNPTSIDLNLTVGSRLPAYCTSMGKVLLADLPEERLFDLIDRVEFLPRGPNTIITRGALLAELQRVRVAGFAVNNEELAYGHRSISAPIRSRAGATIAALNMAVRASMISLDDLTGWLASHLISVADHISSYLGYRPESGTRNMMPAGNAKGIVASDQ